MTKFNCKCCLVVAWVAVLFSCTSPTEKKTATELPIPITDSTTVVETTYSLNQNIINYQQLATWQKDTTTSVVIIDVRPDSLYQKGHIKGAVQLWRPDIESVHYPYKGMMLEKEDVEALMGTLGATADSKIVLYDDNGNVDAARLWWILTTYGHLNSYLLNGGIQNASKMFVSQASTSPIPQVFHFSSSEQPHLKATKQDLLHALTDTNTLILDCRTTEEFIGKIIKKNAFRAGHIPQAIHLNYTHTIAYENKYCFKSNKDLAKLFKHISKHKKIIVYCQSGVRSAHTTFVLYKLLGFPNVANYDGSWIEWSYDQTLPIAKEV